MGDCQRLFDNHADLAGSAVCNAQGIFAGEKTGSSDLFACLIPVFWNILYLLGLEFLQGVDVTSIMYSISGLIFVTARCEVSLLDLTPVA